jgi:hypothetical protein
MNIGILTNLKEVLIFICFPHETVVVLLYMPSSFLF